MLLLSLFLFGQKGPTHQLPSLLFTPQARERVTTDSTREPDGNLLKCIFINREKDEMKDKIEAEAEQKFNERLKEERDKISKTEHDKIELKLIEKEKKDVPIMY